jgi:hypothetical protein
MPDLIAIIVLILLDGAQKGFSWHQLLSVSVTFPLLIAMREYDSALINGSITAIGSITLFSYVSISLSSINILFVYLVSFLTMCLVAIYLHVRNFNRFQSNPESIS